MALRIVLTTILILAYAIICCLEASTLIFQSENIVEFELEGFDGFERFTIIDTNINPINPIDVSTSYEGFAFIKFDNSIQYPMIISRDTVVINLYNPNVAPYIENSPENEFLYDWLSTYVQYKRDIFQLEQELNRIDSLEPEHAEKHTGINRTNEKLEEHEGILSASGFQYATPLLQARLLCESSYGIKTLEELNQKRKAFEQFTNENYEVLQNSDMLMELIKQYFMMHEYVSYLEEGSEDIKGSKTLQQEYILSGVDAWVKVLEGRIDRKDVIEFCAELYYARSMVSQASRIFDYYEDVFPGRNLSESDYLFRPEEQCPDFAYVDADMEFRGNLSRLAEKKIAAVISNHSPFSKVETIMLGRNLEENDITLSIIVVPLEDLSNEHLLIDRMFTGAFFFIHDEAWQEEYLTDDTIVPQFMLLNGENEIIRISNDREDILEILIK